MSFGQQNNSQYAGAYSPWDELTGPSQQQYQMPTRMPLPPRPAYGVLSPSGPRWLKAASGNAHAPRSTAPCYASRPGGGHLAPLPRQTAAPLPRMPAVQLPIACAQRSSQGSMVCLGVSLETYTDNFLALTRGGTNARAVRLGSQEEAKLKTLDLRAIATLHGIAQAGPSKRAVLDRMSDLSLWSPFAFTEAPTQILRLPPDGVKPPVLTFGPEDIAACAWPADADTDASKALDRTLAAGTREPSSQHAPSDVSTGTLLVEALIAPPDPAALRERLVAAISALPEDQRVMPNLQTMVSMAIACDVSQDAVSEFFRGRVLAQLSANAPAMADNANESPGEEEEAEMDEPTVSLLAPPLLPPAWLSSSITKLVATGQRVSAGSGSLSLTGARVACVFEDDIKVPFGPGFATLARGVHIGRVGLAISEAHPADICGVGCTAAHSFFNVRFFAAAADVGLGGPALEFKTDLAERLRVSRWEALLAAATCTSLAIALSDMWLLLDSEPEDSNEQHKSKRPTTVGQGWHSKRARV